MSKISAISLKEYFWPDEFTPDYQFEKSEQFASYLNYYVDRFWDAEKEPEAILPKLRAAVKFANKSVLLDKLELGYHQDPERNSEAFKSVFLTLAASDPNLIVKGGSVYFSLDLKKSFDGVVNANEYYENLWKQTVDTLNR